MSESTKIVLTLPSGEIRKYGLQIEAVRIGRAADNTVVIEDPSLSAHHCVLRQVGAGSKYNIEDLDSTNGIEVNGEETSMAELTHGDVVKIGEIMLLFLQAGRPEIPPLEPFVKKDEPETEAADEDIDDDSEEETEAEADDEEDEAAAPKSSQAPVKLKSADAAKPPKAEKQQEYVQVENSGGCASALVSLLILILAPVVGLCLHHYFKTGRFLILDLISGSGQ